MILHVFKSNIYSGAENVACQIITALSDKEDFIYFSPRGAIEDKLKSLSLYSNYRSYEKLDANTIKDIVAREQVDIIHAHDFTASIVCAMAMKGRIPVISHIHQNPPWLKKVGPKTIAFLYASKYMSHIFAVSDAITTEYIFASMLKTPVTVIGNPFSINSVLSKAENAPASELLYVGRLEHAKNPLLALEVLKRYNSIYSPIHLRMVGDGSLKEECIKYITENELSDYVTLEGFSDNPYSFMANAHAMIIPSNWEGFGLVALEGLSFGTPVICSNVGGLPMIVSDCGYVCNSPSDYVENLHTLMTNAGLYQQLKKSAKARALEFDNINKYSSNIEEIYSQLKG